MVAIFKVLKSANTRPMTMEARCCKVFFPDYSKKQSAELYSRTAAMGKRGEIVCKT